jgi:hypothetical protein
MDRNFKLLRDELAKALAGLDERQTQLKPGGDPARWSIQQIVGHLLLTYKATIEAVDARVAKGAATKASPSVAQRVGQFALCRIGYFPRGRLAPERVTAATDAPAVPGAGLTAQADAAIGEMDRRFTAGEQIFGSRRRAISHMVLGPLSIGQWRRFHLIHGRHHIKQIARIRQEYGI